MDDPSHQLVTKQNEPFKLLFVDADIALIVAMIEFAAIMMGSYVVPTAIACTVGYGLQHLRTHYPRGYITHYFVYWLLPPVFRPLQATPPSMFREFIG